MSFLLGMVRHVQACLKFSKIIIYQYIWRELSDGMVLIFCIQSDIQKTYESVLSFLLGVVSHIQGCPKCSKIANYQYLWKEMSGKRWIPWLFVCSQTWVRATCKLGHFCWVWSGMVHVWNCIKFSKIRNKQYLGKELSDSLDILQTVRHGPKLWINFVIF